MGKHKRKHDSIEGKVDDVQNAERSNIDNDSEYVTKSKKKKKRNMHETDLEKNGAHTENIEADPESKQHKKKKKKKHLDSDNSLSENRNESLVVERNVSSTESPRKRKHSKENDTGIPHNGKSQTKNSTDQNGLVDEIDTEAPKKKKKKKKKKNINKESQEEVNEHEASSEISAAIGNDNCDIDRKNVESEVADTAIEANTKAHKEKKKKSKHHACKEEASEDECQKDTNDNDVYEDDKNDEFTDIKSKKKKNKKNKESKEIDNSEKVENSLVTQNDTVNRIDSPRDYNQEHKDKNTATAINGQWDTNAFGDEAKQNKFLRLLGGFKKGADTSSIQKRMFNDKNSPKQTSTSPSRFGGSVAMNKSQQEEYKKAMETEYNSAITSHFNRGIGLGFQKPEPKKTFSIDTQTSKSVKFDDSD